MQEQPCRVKRRGGRGPQDILAELCLQSTHYLSTEETSEWSQGGWARRGTKTSGSHMELGGMWSAGDSPYEAKSWMELQVPGREGAAKEEKEREDWGLGQSHLESKS